jgi:hypothetical protein
VNRLTDQQLLREYAEGRSEAAVAELVRPHIDLIFSAALRMVHRMNFVGMSKALQIRSGRSFDAASKHK